MNHRRSWIVTTWCVAVDLGLAALIVTRERPTAFGAAVMVVVLCASTAAMWVSWGADA